MTTNPAPDWRERGRPILGLAVAVALLFLMPTMLQAQRAQEAQPLPTIEAKTEGMTFIEGFFPLYYEAEHDRLWMEVSRFDTEVLHMAGFAAGLGSNDIGLDRGGGAGSRVVTFERHGRKLLMVQPNYRFRVESDNPAEERAVRDAFARSVLFSFGVAAESGGRVLVDLTDFVLSDQTQIARRLGGYQFNRDRSSIYLPMTQGFPENTEIEAELTFVQGGSAAATPRRGGGGGFFESVASVAATSAAASLRVHQSFVKLPDEPIEPRAWDPRQALGAATWVDYNTPLGEDMVERVVRRHRLEKVDPSTAVSDPVEPIVWYIDPATPEKWVPYFKQAVEDWQPAFEAAGFSNAIVAREAPDDPDWSPEDARISVIRWLPSTTENAMGPHVHDPRSGEILSAHVQIYQNVQRLQLSWYFAQASAVDPRARSMPFPDDLMGEALRFVVAHEVGHSLGFPHNFKASATYPVDSLRSASFLEEWGHVPSIMDYARFNYLVQPEDNVPVELLIPSIGPYDRYATM